MLNKSLKLNPQIFDQEVGFAGLRDGFGQGLLLAGAKSNKIMAVCADLRDSTRCSLFAQKYPDRFIEVGVAEQNLATVASGLANYGKIPFICSFAAFSPSRNFEQIRTSICLSNLPVKIVGAHAGINVGADGATHQVLEDIGLMRMLPNMVVIAPCDFEQTKKATLAVAFNNQPSYIRFGRESSPQITTSQTPFEIGKAQVLVPGKKVTIIACGALTYEALMAAKQLKSQGISSEVINNHTIKPLDERTILNSVKKTRAVVTIEDHQIAGGLGSAIAEFLIKKYPVTIEMIGIQNRFGQSGLVQELKTEYGLDKNSIIRAVKKVLKKNKQK